MKEITLKEILEMQPQQIVDFLTSLDMQERMDFYNTLLDRHKAFLAEQIECVMGAVKFSDIAAQSGATAEMPAEELEALAKEGNAAAQYYLSQYFIEKWKAEHPFYELPDDYENDQPSMEAIRNEWEAARRWAIDCAELGFKEGFYAQALCYDGVMLPSYYAKKNIDEYYRTYPIVRYEQVVTEKYDRELALKAACRLGEIYSAREYEELNGIDEMRAELADRFRFRCQEAAAFKTEELRLSAECALDDLRFYDEQRIDSAEKLIAEYPGNEEKLNAYIAFHKRQIEGIKTEY